MPYLPKELGLTHTQARRAMVTGQVPNAALYPWSQRRLVFQTPQSNPFPRYGAAVNAVASKDGDIYMMGGLINGSMVKGDLWMIESGGGTLSCYPIATVSEGPGPRVGHSSLLVGNAFIVFGGDTKMDDSDTLDDTLYLLNTSSRQWSRAAPPGPRPAGRYGHTLNILGSRIYIFGGQVEGTFFNDLIAFDLNALQHPTNQWEFLLPNTVEGEPEHALVPAARTNHSVISYNDQLYLFGGTDGNRWFNDVWTYDPRTNSWSQQDCIGYIPAPREGHSAALVGDVMYIFGGRTEEGTDLGDLAAFRITSRRWYTFQNMGPSPSPRSGHSMTAHGKQIVVLAGEPSSAPRDASELSMVYLLDTAKIRYPNDQPTSGSKDASATSPKRRPSNDFKSGMAPPRSVSREGQTPYGNDLSRTGSAARDASAMNAIPMHRPVEGPPNAPGAPPSARLPRASLAQAPAGPPPMGQAPTPMNQKPNGSQQQQGQVRSKPPISAANRGFGPSMDTIRSIPTENQTQPQPPREAPKEMVRTTSGREQSPGGRQGRHTPTQGAVSKAKAMEAGEAAPLMHSGPSRQRSQRSQRGQSSIDSSEEGLLGRSGSTKHYSDGMVDARSLRSVNDEPRSPKLTPHQEALMKELEAAKSRNAWYASELALARKAGYHSTSPASPTFDEKSANQFGDEDKPLIDAFMTMRGELLKMQQALDQQSASTAKKIAEAEHQRDAAISEAAYARAKLAAHSGSQNSTPQPDSSRDLDDQSGERSTDISRRLALALAAQNEYKSKIESLSNELASERRARELAEESMEAAQKRIDEHNSSRNPVELEGLRAELHETKMAHRAEAGQRAQAEEQLRMLRVDKDDLGQKHEELSSRLADHTQSLAGLEAAVAASTNKANVFERQVEQERQHREAVESKLAQLRAEHEDRTRELEETSRRLRDTQELADSHAKEASTHREALMSGFARLSSPSANSDRDSITEQRLAVLQQSTDRAHELARINQEAADTAARKLRSAEERIAGLETYQEQSSREGLQIRRQLQAALKEVQTYQSENSELRASLESHQRDASALAVQHGALKDLLGERGINISDARRSPMFDTSPGSRFGTPEQSRLRELEQQLQLSMKAHEETRHAMESREQEADRTYREKLEQLENDYQSAVHYVKGTEKMLKRMKDELAKYKTQNKSLQSELDATKGNVLNADSAAASNWASERDTLQKSIDDLKSQTSSQVSQLTMNISAIQRELAATQAERDNYKAEHERLSQSTEQTERDLLQLKNENAHLESRAKDAEHKVTLLLDQVGQSVGNYRRQSQIQAKEAPTGLQSPGLPNGIHGHSRGLSTGSSIADSSTHEEDVLNHNRGSLALDNLAEELDQLRSQWETSNRSYRLSREFDFEKTPTRDTASGEEPLSEGLANWRKRLDQEESGAPGPSTSQAHSEAPIKRADSMI